MLLRATPKPERLTDADLMARMLQEGKWLEKFKLVAYRGPFGKWFEEKKANKWKYFNQLKRELDTRGIDSNGRVRASMNSPDSVHQILALYARNAAAGREATTEALHAYLNMPEDSQKNGPS